MRLFISMYIQKICLITGLYYDFLVKKEIYDHDEIMDELTNVPKHYTNFIKKARRRYFN